jgi:hypothetical protein
MSPKQTCPECHLVFEAALPENGVLACPLCNRAFAPHSPVPEVPVAAAPQPEVSGRQVLRGVTVVAALMVLTGGLTYAYHLMDNIGRKPVATPTPAAHAPSPVASSPPVMEIIPSSPLPSAMVSRPRAMESRPERRPFAVPAEPRRPLTLAERVNRAIDAGVGYLRIHHGEHKEYRREIGLLGLTLLECGIPANDASIQQIAAWLRAQERELWQTYELTLAILFFDRLGAEGDRPLIRTFGQRLLEGQFECGAWTYSCLANERPQRRTRTSSGVPYIPPARPWQNPTPPRNRPVQRRIAYHGDNSNTQFALLGLWVAQRHGVSARSALLTSEQYFRATQHGDGAWAYHPLANNWRDSMTCAGLMSLAMHYGVTFGRGRDIRPDHRITIHDVAVQQGIRYLAASLDKISLAGNRIVGVEARDPLYFLWSLERMAVIYDLKMIGKREWYPWAAELLVETQGPDGRWNGMGDVVGTCFALLILKRSNFAADLQLAVRQPPAPQRDLTGPTILQGVDAMQGLAGKPKPPPPMQGTTGGTPSPSGLGPSITRTPGSKR